MNYVINTPIDPSFFFSDILSHMSWMEGEKPDPKKIARFFQTQPGAVRTREEPKDPNAPLKEKGKKKPKNETGNIRKKLWF